MKRSSYGERDYAFGQLMLTLRTHIGLTQAGLAERLGVSRRAVAEWEAGSGYPKAERLKQLIALGVRASAFAAGREAEEIRVLWKAAHQKVLLDEQWLQGLLGKHRPPLTLVAPQSVEQNRLGEQTTTQPVLGRRVDWGEALAVPSFYDREEELATLTQWVAQDRCRVVSVLGMGGIGKSALATRVMHRVAAHFEVVLWRSLRDAPGCSALLEDCLQVLSPQPLREVPTSLERRLGLLLEYLRQARALLVLDNLEVLLEEREGTGRMRAGYEDYGRLLRQVAETEHQSCLLLTSREKPRELVVLEGSRTPVRSLRLDGLDAVASEQLLAGKEVVGLPHDRERLIELYAGNPLALKIVAQIIVDLFGSEIAPFLEQGEVVFGSVRELLAEQFDRLSATEQTVLLWLAILREPVSIEELLAVLGTPRPGMQVLEAIEALRRRSLIERGQRRGSFTLQSVVLEYAAVRLIAEASSEIEQGRLVRLIEHGLELATAKEYVRQTQQRLIVAPIVVSLRSAYQGRAEVEERLLALLDQLRELEDYAQGYGPANLLALLRELRGHLRGLDLSRLAIRGAYLQGVEMQDTNLKGAMLRETLFTEAMHLVTSVAVSATGTTWAAGSDSGKICLWHEDGRLLHMIRSAHSDCVNALAFSPDGHYLSSASEDATIKFWHAESGALHLVLQGHRASVTSFAFAPDGRHLISGSDDGTMRLWDTSTGTCIRIFENSHVDGVRVAWSPDNALVASGGADRVIQLWETQTWTCVQTLSGHAHWIQGLAFSPDSTRLASASRDQTVRVWDVVNSSTKAVLRGHTDFVRMAAWSPDQQTIASCSNDGTIRIWDVESNRQRSLLRDHTNVVCAIAFTPNGNRLLSGSEDRTLRLWEIDSGVCVRVVQGYSLSLLAVAWSPDGTHLASGNSEKALTLWNIADGTARQFLGHQGAVRTVAWSPDGTRIASGSYDHTIRIWDTTTGTCLHILQGHESFVMSISWSPDGQCLASGSWDQTVRVWNINDGSCRWIGHSGEPVRIVAWNPTSMLVASGNNGGTINVWQGENGTQQSSMPTHSRAVYGLAWHPVDALLASGGEDGVLRCWDTSRGTQSTIFADDRAPITTVVWNRQGDLLISGSKDGMLRWWDSQNKTQRHAQQGHRAWIYASSVSPDDTLLASCGSDGLIQLWDMSHATHSAALHSEQPYEALDITDALGLSEAQKASLKLLGAVGN